MPDHNSLHSVQLARSSNNYHTAEGELRAPSACHTQDTAALLQSRGVHAVGGKLTEPEPMQTLIRQTGQT